MPDVAKQLHHIFLAKGVHATAAIEGNALTEAQVLSLVKSEQPEGAATSYAIQEVNNILEAANTILADIEREGSIPITPDLIKRYNKTVLSNLETEEHVVPGEISKVQVGVPNYIGCPPELCERLLQQYCEWLNGETFTSHDGNPADEILVGLIKAIFAHLYLVWIHPFGDGNGRTARLLEVQILLEAGVPS
jgi:Fic family protein